jgi:predicted transcriptional regulator of viral defense system
MKKEGIKALYRSQNTVFTFKDIALLLRENNAANLRSKVNYFVKKGDLYQVRKGLYTKEKDYVKFELATKIYTPSYVSFETVLLQSGVIFQFYSQIWVASYLTREITIGDQAYAYRKIKDSALTNKTGIEDKENYSIATPERAFLDVVYLNGDYYFDRLSALNWDRVFEILPIYNNKRMEKKVHEYSQHQST